MVKKYTIIYMRIVILCIFALLNVNLYAIYTTNNLAPTFAIYSMEDVKHPALEGAFFIMRTRKEKICGIYKITNPKGKVYIGQSVNIHKRWRVYKRLKCEGQVKLYNSFIKYGINKHKFEVIHQCPKEQLNELEVYYIQLYQCFDSEHGLNLKSGGDCGGSPSKETREKMSKLTIRRFGESNFSARAVYVYDFQGKCLGRYDTMTQAAISIAIPVKKIHDISSCCLGNRKSVCGYQFRYANQVDGSDIEPYKRKDTTGANNPSYKNRGSKHIYARKLNQLNIETGEIIKTWGSVKEASEALNLSYTAIYNCLFRGTNKSLGFGWEYAEDKKIRERPINQLTKEGVFIREWKSKAEACSVLNLVEGNIWSCCNGRRKFAGGFKWEYKQKS